MRVRLLAIAATAALGGAATTSILSAGADEAVPSRQSATATKGGRTYEQQPGRSAADDFAVLRRAKTPSDVLDASRAPKGAVVAEARRLRKFDTGETAYVVPGASGQVCLVLTDSEGASSNCGPASYAAQEGLVLITQCVGRSQRRQIVGLVSDGQHLVELREDNAAVTTLSLNDNAFTYNGPLKGRQLAFAGHQVDLPPARCGG